VQGEAEDGSLAAREARAALDGLPRGKAPGSDGLTYEFYTAMWDVVGGPLIAAFNYSFQRPELSAVRGAAGSGSSSSSTRGVASPGPTPPAAGPSPCSTAT
jgi:hypothetical protein